MTATNVENHFDKCCGPQLVVKPGAVPHKNYIFNVKKGKLLLEVLYIYNIIYLREIHL